MMKFLTVATILSMSTAALAYPPSILGFTGNSRLDYCTGFNPLVEVTKVDIKTGTDKSLNLTGIAKTEIKEGTLSAVGFTLGFLSGPGKDFDFCNGLGVKCPVKAGETFTASYKLPFKTLVPETSFTASVYLASPGSYFPDLLCIDGPWKESRALVVEEKPQMPLWLSAQHWEMK